MAQVEPMGDSNVTTATTDGSMMHSGKFKDRNLERQYGLFKLDYHKPAVFIFIVQLLCLETGTFVNSWMRYSAKVLPHVVLMALFALTSITLLISLHVFKMTLKPFIFYVLILFAFSQIYVDMTLSAYTLSPVTSLPWLLVAMVTSYKTLPLPVLYCVLLNGLGFTTYSLLVTLLPQAKFDGPDFAIPNTIGSNVLLFLCVNLLGLLWSLRTDHRLRQAFAESQSSLSVNLLIEESTKEQERLLLSVLPKHVASEMLKDWGTEVGGQFRKIYMNRHENVSILFADIVGFTAMSSLVTPSQLVQILNDLFANFDKLAEKFHQLRIKILGDCYYSISGCPEPRPDHAVLSIHMGLAMVTAIGEVREKTGSGVNMRVGIHTGAVLAGVMGQQRWQYDVLGKEVTFANKMESGGLPGRVHISETTASFLAGEFELEGGDGEAREEAIRLAAVKTYLVKAIIKPYPQGTLDENSKDASTDSMEKIEISNLKDAGTKEQPTVKSFSQATEPSNVLTLRFLDLDLEETYSRSLRNDLDLAVSLTCPVIVVVTSLLSQICVLPFSLSSLLTLLFPLLITGCVAIIPAVLHFPKRFPRLIRNLSEALTTRFVGRHVVVLVLVVTMATADMVDLHVCTASWQPDEMANTTQSIANRTLCNYPVYFCNSILLILLTVHLQYQVSYLLRAFLLAVITILSCVFYNVTVQSAFSDYDSIILLYRENEDFIPSSIYFTIILSFICIFLMVSSRHCESQRRRLFIFSRQMEENQSKIDVLQEKNKALVYNILPAHVAMHFTGTKRKDEDLYSQQYSEVGVMFASCPNFNDHYTEDAINNHGVEWMRLLNEIISDYDDLLNDERFANIVKIKTIGPTYMAASGLNLAQPIDEGAPIVQRWRHLADLVEFGLALKETLERINSQSFNHFMLRIGINHGPILAGVIGARKPHYDIWGNSVNVSSRMESTGKLGEIQVVEETMLILKEFGYTFTQRGVVKVKGKGDLMTYFLTGRQVPPST